jgi:hypothetical protein
MQPIKGFWFSGGRVREATRPNQEVAMSLIGRSLWRGAVLGLAVASLSAPSVAAARTAPSAGLRQTIDVSAGPVTYSITPTGGEFSAGDVSCAYVLAPESATATRAGGCQALGHSFIYVVPASGLPALNIDGNWMTQNPFAS